MNWYKKAQEEPEPPEEFVEEPEAAEDYELNVEPEVFRFFMREWDVEHAKEIIRENPRPLQRYNPEYAKSFMGMIATYPEIMEFADLSHPIIVATLDDGGEISHLPIDGWHRLKKAQKMGVKSLPAYVLTLEETKEISNR